jgi:hypothetical protein
MDGLGRGDSQSLERVERPVHEGVDVQLELGALVIVELEQVGEEVLVLRELSLDRHRAAQFVTYDVLAS